MISDFVKGKKQYDYPSEIQKGIQLHRAIDNFTDNHSATKRINEFFRPQYRLYSGAFTDIVYDYFLANDRNEFANETLLKTFATSTYEKMKQYEQFFPERFALMFLYMQQQDWLSNYRLQPMIEKSFGGLVRRATYLKESAGAFTIFTNHVDEIQIHYSEFFPEVKRFAADTLDALLKQ